MFNNNIKQIHGNGRHGCKKKWIQSRKTKKNPWMTVTQSWSQFTLFSFFFFFFLNFILFLNFTSVHFKTGRKGLSFVFQEVIRWGFPGEAVGKNPPASSRDAGDVSLILGSGRSPGVGNSSPLQCSCLENFMGGGAWWATVRRSPRFGVSNWAYITQVILQHKMWDVYNGILLSHKKGCCCCCCCC